jgi:glycosyltransferase involved in cell wall biosynthesis
MNAFTCLRTLFFPNEDFQIYLNAADVVVLPFSQVLTSGSAIAALSFGKPVIVPALGCLPELVDDSMGILYDPKDTGALSKALLDIRRCDLDRAGCAAFARAKSLDWQRIASRVAEVYRA